MELNKAIEMSGITALRSLVNEIDFLEDERRRAYKDLRASELECERLKAQNERLMFALGRHAWREMVSDCRLTKTRRKYLAR